MVERLKHLDNSDSLKKALAKNLLENAAFIYWAFESELDFDCYVDENRNAVVAIEKGDEKHVVFTGKWHNRRLPTELLNKDGFFVSACPPDVMKLLRKKYKIDGEWPCWFYLAPDGFGTGPWDELGGIRQDEIPMVAKHWGLSDDPESHIRKRVEKYESVCVRVDGKPVSWAGLHFEIDNVANMGFAHTLKEERRKGYAALVTKALVNRVVKRGKKGTCHIIKDNKESIALCEHLGFTRIGEAAWAEVGPLLE